MKKVFFIVAFALACISLNAQSLSVKLDGKTVNDGDKLTFEGKVDPIDFNNLSIKRYFELTNTTDAEISYEGNYVAVGATSGSFSWCTYVCYDGPLSAEEIAAGATVGNTAPFKYYVQFTPDSASVLSTSVFKIKFFVSGAESTDKVELTLTFINNPDLPDVSNEEVLAENVKVSAYPNPVKDVVNFDFELGNNAPAKLFIRNLSGQLVRSVNVTSLSNIHLNVADLKAGLYFCGIEQAGRTISVRKLIKL